VAGALLETVSLNNDMGDVGELLCQSRIAPLLPGAQVDTGVVAASQTLDDVGVTAKG